MKILVFNPSLNKGGAAQVVEDTCKHYLKQGASVTVVTADDSHLQGAKTLNIQKQLGWNRLRRFTVARLESELGLQYLFRPKWPEVKALLGSEHFDVAHVHNVHGSYLHLQFVSQLLVDMSVVWTLHDMWPLTGHCAHSLNCGRWQTGCGKCPHLKTYPEVGLDFTDRLLSLKKIPSDLLQKLCLVSPSQWLDQKIERSIYRGAHHEQIPNSIDIKLFTNIDKSRARAKLGIAEGEFTIAFGAHLGRKNPFKGFDHLDRALKLASDRGMIGCLITFGSRGYVPPKGFRLIEFKYLEKRDLIEKLSAADVFAFPSIAESFGLIAVESLACGTPVVAFNVSAIPEYVKHERTGYLASPFEVESFLSGLEWARNLSTETRKNVAETARKLVFENYDLEKNMQRYFKLCSEMT